MFLHGVFDLALGCGIAVGGEQRHGTAPTEYTLVVGGKIPAEEVRIKLIKDWADFVFQPDYRLTTLPEVASHTRNHHHLPDMPSTAEVANDGVRLGEMQAKRLRKIEDLTLHARLQQLVQDRSFHHVQDR